MAEEVRCPTDVDKSAVEVAAVAEQPSASIEQISFCRADDRGYGPDG